MSKANVEFKREVRYITVKVKDLVAADVTEDDRMAFVRVCEAATQARLAAGKPPFNAVVVEQDWPEFEPTWAAIEARMTGKQPPAVSAEPAAFFVVDPTGAEDGPLYSQAAREFWNDGDTVPLYRHAAPPPSAQIAQDIATNWLPNIKRRESESSKEKAMHNYCIDLCIKHVLAYVATPQSAAPSEINREAGDFQEKFKAKGGA